MKKLSKTEVEEEVKHFFEDIKSKSQREVKKIKKLAMRNSIKLKDKRKLFCKKCFKPYKNPKTRIKKGFKIIICENCGNRSRWKIASNENKKIK